MGKEMCQALPAFAKSSLRFIFCGVGSSLFTPALSLSPHHTTISMPFLAKTKTMESALSILRSRTYTLESRTTNPPSNQPQRGTEGQGGVWVYLREELPSGVNSIPLGIYAFMSGYVSSAFLLLGLGADLDYSLAW